MLEVEVALILAAFAAVTLASLIAQQSRVARRVAGPFGGGGEVYVVAPSDPLLRQLGQAAEISVEVPAVEPPPALVFAEGEITILHAEPLEGGLSLLVDIVPNLPVAAP